MLSKVRLHIRQQSVGYIALFIALGGTGAYASHLVVRSSDIVDGEVRNPDIAEQAVGSGKVKNQSLGWQDIAPESIGSGRIADGTLLRRDFRAGELPQGAVSFSFHVPTDSITYFEQVRTAGLTPNVWCNRAGDNTVRVGLYGTINKPLYATGIAIRNGAVTGVDHSQTAVWYSPGATSTDDADLVAMNSEFGKFASVQLGSFNGGTAGCNFHGVITPPSN